MPTANAPAIAATTHDPVIKPASPATPTAPMTLAQRGQAPGLGMIAASAAEVVTPLVQW
jgi:hypothetical protein